MQNNHIHIVAVHGGAGCCTSCGMVADLRPYGPNYSQICFECAMKDEKAVAERFFKLIEGQDVVIP